MENGHETATNVQKHLIKKYKSKYGKHYLLDYLKQFYPDATWLNLTKEQAQRIITGRKLHEKHYKAKMRDKKL